MTPDTTPDPDERLGAFADELAGGGVPGGDTPDPGAADQRLAAAVAAAFGVVLDPAPGEIEALLDDAGEEPVALPPPELPADYELGEEIGRGGMGVVYRAKQRSLDRAVAVKVLRPGDLMLGNAIRRFTHEARVLAKLRHRHIVSIHEVGHVRGQVYFTMDLIEGRDLAQILDAGPLSPAHPVRLLRQVAGAIAYTHAHGLVHRDLKPANILVDGEGEACVTDFGLALEMGGGDQLTMTGQILGTPAYMSPEQARGQTGAVGEATDVWALGAILYECLTGHVPFERGTPIEQIHAVLHDDPVRPRKLDSGVPEDLETICLKALEKRPERRYATARALLEDLERWESGLPIRAVAATPVQRVGRWLARHRAPVLSAAGAGVVAFLVFFLAVWPMLRPGPIQVLEAADQQFARGDLESADILYSAALGTVADREMEDARMRRFVEARIHTARLLAAAGRKQDAVERLRDAVELAGGGRELRSWVEGRLLEFEIAVVKSGDLDDAFGELRRAVSLARMKSPASPGSSSSLSTAASVVVGTLRHGRTETVEGLRTEVHHRLVAVLTHPDTWPSVSDWIVEDPERAVDRLVLSVAAAYDIDPPPRVMQHIGGIRATAAEVLDDAGRDALAELAFDEDQTEPFRRAAGTLLGWSADLPVSLVENPIGHGDLMRHASDVGAIVQAWNQVRDLDPAQGWRRRLELARAEIQHCATWPRGAEERERWTTAPRTDLSALRSFILRYAPRPDRRLVGEPTTLRAAIDDALVAPDPRDPYVAALGLPSRPGPDDVDALLEHMAVHRDHVEWVDLLLRLTLPAAQCPSVLLGESADAIEMRWRRHRLRSESKSYTRQSARFLFEAGTWRLAPGMSESRPVVPGEMTTFAWSLPDASSAAVRLGFHAPGTIPSPGGDREIGGMRGFLFDPSTIGQFSDGRGGDGFAFAVDQQVGATSEPDHGRNLVLVARFASGASGNPWTRSEWEAQLVEDVRRLADLAETTTPPWHFHNRFQRAVQSLSLILAHLPVADAVPHLQRLSTHFETTALDFDVTPEMVLLARLMCGDEGVLSEPRFEKALAGGFDEFVQDVIGPGNKYWARLLVLTESDRIRDLAASRVLDGLSQDVAGDLLSAQEAGAVELPPEIDAVVRGLGGGPGPWRTAVAASPGPILLAGMLALLALVATGFVLLAERLVSPAARPLAAAALAAVGLFVLGVNVNVNGVDLVPNAGGALLVVLALWRLRLDARGRALRFGLAAFAGAAVAWAIDVDALRTLAAALTAAGVTALVAVARDLTPVVPPANGRDPSKPRSVSAVRLFLGTLFTAVVATLVFAGLVSGNVLVVVALLISFVAIPGAMALQGILQSASPARRLRALPLPFVVGYVAPLALGYGATLLARITGAQMNYELRGTPGVFVLLVVTLSVAWAAARLFGAARARAAFLRRAERD